MFRYLALIWPKDDAAAQETAIHLIERHTARVPAWPTALRRSGVFVSYTGARAGSNEIYRLEGGTGIVLGKLFQRECDGISTSAPCAPDEHQTRPILQSRGRTLIDRYWGRYVAILHDSEPEAVRILRDPSGGLPCYRMTYRGITVVFSAIEDVQCLVLGPFTLNWKRLTEWLCMMKDPSPQTSLCEVTQVLGGECVELRRGTESSHSFYWNPLEVARSNPIDNPLQATQAMRDCVTDTVRAWASCYSGIALSLSGGLDSSIVYGALRDSPACSKLTCFHFYPIGPDMDERHFARLVAHSGGSQLLERPRNSKLSFAPLLGVAASPDPDNYLGALENSQQDAALAMEHHATAIFTGGAGDQLFYQANATLAASDYLYDKGLRPELLRVAFDSARIDNVSIWRVLRDAYAEFVRPGHSSWFHRLSAKMPLIRPEAFAEVYKSQFHAHPLLRDPQGLPAGKLWHLAQVICPAGFYDPLGCPEDPERLAPLHSQPIIELCLRLPLYVLTSGGWDRAIARRAFRDELPREVANRRHKGGIEHHVQELFAHNIAFMRELLLDGALVREGIIDRAALAVVLSGKPGHLIQATTYELLTFVAIEAWSRRWLCRDAAPPGALHAA